MESRLVAHLQRLNGWRLWLLFSLAAVLVVLLIVSLMDLALMGRITVDYLLTGLVAAGIVAPTSLFLLSTLLREIARHQQQDLSRVLASAEARIREELTEREEQYRAIVNQAGDGIDLVDAETLRFVEVNEAACRMLGYRRDEMIGMPVAAIQATPDEAAVRDIVARIVRAGEASFENRHRRSDGRIIDVVVNVRTIRLRGRTCLVGVWHDITEREEAEWNLKMAVEVTQVVFWKFDYPSQTLHFDQANLPVLGLEPDESLTSLQGWLDRVHPEEAGAFMARYQAALAPQGPVFDLEYRLRQHNGQYQWIHTKGRFIRRDADGLPELAVGTSMNITARKQIEQAARESEQRSRNLATLLRMMADNVPDMIWAKDLDKRFLFANRATCRQLLNARDTDEPVGKDHLFFARRERQAHPENPQWHTFGELCQDSDAITMARLAPSEFEEFGHIEGRMTYLEVRKAPFLNELGEAIGTVGSGRDITERKRTEAELRRSEARYQMVADHVSDVIWLYELGTDRFVYVSPSIMKLRGFTVDEVMSQSLAQTLTPQSYDLVQQLLPKRLAAFAAGDPASVTQTHQVEQNRKDGSTVATEMVTTLIADANGRVTHVQGVTRDITERRRVEAELERHRRHLEELVQQRSSALLATEARASRILDSAADGLYGADSEGCITFINPAACRMLGYAAEQVLGRSAHELFHHTRPDGRPYPAAECALREAWRTGHECRIDDDTYWHADGHPLPVNLACHPIVEQGQIVGTVVSVVDVSTQRAATQAREQALVAAENLARARSEFLANMSHEIRTPMNGVLGFAQIGLRQHKDADKARSAFERILASGNQLLAVVNEILDFSKVDAGKLQIEATSVSLDEVLGHALQHVADRARAKALVLRLDKAEDLPKRCISDPLRLGQVLLNLLTNAIKFTPAGSVTLSAARQGPQLVFRVTDTGIGMSPDQLGTIFNPFQQADGSTTRKFGGTGLGLAICKRLLELMHGEIRVESSPGGGSLFEVRLPYVAPSAPADADPVLPATPPTRPLAKLSILLVEDDDISQKVLELMLQDAGAQVVLASDGFSAVERVFAAGAAAFDVVLMDLQMPNMDGYESTRRIRELAPDLPIIGQTANAFEEDRAKCLAAGMAGHIAKPIDAQALTSLVLQVLAARRTAA